MSVYCGLKAEIIDYTRRGYHINIIDKNKPKNGFIGWEWSDEMFESISSIRKNLRYYLASIFDGFLGNLFAHVEYEYLTYNRPYTNSMGGNIYDPYGNQYMPGKTVVQVNSIFVGGGYRQPVTNRIGLDFMILFNLNDSYNSPYSNPIFRMGVGVGL